MLAPPVLTDHPVFHPCQDGRKRALKIPLHNPLISVYLFEIRESEREVPIGKVTRNNRQPRSAFDTLHLFAI